MKGTFFQRPLEFKLQVNGESWRQGDDIAGELVVKNHGNETIALDGVNVALAYGELKKVRQKSSDAFEIMNTTAFESDRQVAPQTESTLGWIFKTDRNFPITDTSGGLFLIYGRGNAGEQMGQLQLNMQPTAIITEFLSAFTTQYRFVLKTLKAGKKGVEAKLAPPDSRAFATLEHVLVSFSFEGETLSAHYAFKVKKVEATASAFDVKKQKKDLTQTFKREEYLLPSGRFDHERIEGAIKEAISQVESKVLF